MTQVLKDEGSWSGTRRAWLRQGLVVCQIALAVILVIGAGLLIRSLGRVFSGPGFDPAPVITLRLRPALVKYPTDKALAFHRDVIRRLEALPGVVSASPADGAATSPATAGGEQMVTIVGAGGERDRELAARQTRAGPRYFSTLGVALTEGHEFDDRDHAQAPRVAVVNDVLARRIAHDGRVSGRIVIAGGQPHRIVGVVRDAQYYAAGQPPQAVVYRAYWQPNADGGFNKDSRTLVRVRGDAHVMMSAIRRAVSSVDPAVPISEAYPLTERLAYEFQPVRSARMLLVTFGALALFLSAVGLYGVLAFDVADRTREIGLRVALGAGGRDVAALVVRDGLAMTATGVAVGVLAAWASARLAAALLYGVTWTDRIAFLAGPLILIVVALAASYLPARRAARVSPLTALRYD